VGATGTLVDVPISVTPGDGILGIDMTITYDPAVLQAQNVTVSGIAASQAFALARNLTTPGVIVVTEYGMQNPLVGSGEIAKIRFLVNGSPGATSALTFTSASINEHTVPVEIDDGLFSITCAGATNGVSCNDGNPCTGGDACQGGVCAGVAIQVPHEIAGVTFGADHATITWSSAASAGPGTVHDVIRGIGTQLPVGSGAGESCLVPGSAAATASDTATPPAGGLYWYLVRGRNGCGNGTYGFRRIAGVPGPERTSAVCP
jgi:hypothetical protein